MVRRKDLFDDDEGSENKSEGSEKPCLLYGYGSYGICIDPGFHRLILPYLDRGMALYNNPI